MAKYVIEDTTLTNIANAIREKTGKTDAITPANFDTEIAGIQSGGNSTITSGFIVNKWNTNGYPVDISLVGMTTINQYYFYTYLYYGSAYSVFSSLENVNFCENTTRIAIGAFMNCKKLNITELPDTISRIDGDAFNGCNALALTKLPASFEDTIYIKTFYGCSNLAIKEIPVGIDTLGNNAFENCTSLSELTFLGKISGFGSSVFKGCSNLEKIVLGNTTSVPTLQDTYVFQNTPIASGTGYIYVLDTLVDSYKSSTNWSKYADQIKPISELEGN